MRKTFKLVYYVRNMFEQVYLYVRSMFGQVHLGGGLTAVVMTQEEKREAYTLTPAILQELTAPIHIAPVRKQIMKRFEEIYQPNLLMRMYDRLRNLCSA